MEAKYAMPSTTSTDDRIREKELIAQACLGNAVALRELVVLHQDRLFAFIWRMVRNHHDAEEICQDTFLKAFKSLDTFISDYRFSTWLFTIGYRVCLNQIRRKRALTGEQDLATLPDKGLNDPSDTLESAEVTQLRAQVWAGVEHLSEPQRAAILLFYRHEMGCQEIARVMGVPVATVKSHLHRGRNRLRELLEPITEQDLQVYRNRPSLAG